MTQALRLKSGQLVNPKRFDQDQLIEFCAAGALWEEVPAGFFEPVDLKAEQDSEEASTNDSENDNDGEGEGPEDGEKQPQRKAAAAKKTAKKGD